MRFRLLSCTNRGEPWGHREAMESTFVPFPYAAKEKGDRELVGEYLIKHINPKKYKVC